MAALPNVRPIGRRRSHGAVALFAAGMLLAGFWLAAAPPAYAQLLTFPEVAPPKPKPKPKGGGQDQMLVQAREIDYDYTNNRVSAVGSVQMYYSGSTIEADRIVYDQKTKRLRAEGNVRLTEADGKITHGEIIELSDDYRDGFVDSLRLDSPDQTRMAASRADRSGGNFTVFQSGVYTACEACKDDPKKPPLWQVKGARIIHDQGEKMMYFEDAQLEFFGLPVAYLPYFSAPDQTVKRKTGFLLPTNSFSSRYGYGLETPYYFALAPDYDVTLSPKFTSQQGPVMQAEYRQRLLNGAFSIRGAGIYQLDKNAFVTPGNEREFRGNVEGTGQFAITDKWVWGFDALAITDKTFLQDYSPSLSRYRTAPDPLQTGKSEGLSQIYIAGKGDRSYFDARSLYYYGFSAADNQAQLPVIHPVVDYNYTFKNPILGGELGYRVNLTSLSRQSADFAPITTLGNTNCLQTADPTVKIQKDCLLRGVPGDYTRFSAEANWRRSITDQYGQIFTPFARLRTDVASLSVRNETGVSNYLSTGDSELGRVMPTVGLEYRYPFISAHSWGTQTLEPIAQVIARPNETQIGKFPNEDAQSLVFDDTNLFRVDKFSGWDRVEGGGRANAGLQYTAQFNQGGNLSALFGQSYQLYGRNSFAAGSLTNTGVDSGLDKAQSDYVARVAYQPDRFFKYTSRFRFDKDTFAVRRFETEASANFGRWTASLLYGSYDAQPEIGFLSRRQGILGTGSVKLDANWVLTGAARYNIQFDKFDYTQIGLGYVDDCLILALNYITSYTYGVAAGTTSDTAAHVVMLQLSLRTLGGTTASTVVGGAGGLPGL